MAAQTRAIAEKVTDADAKRTLLQSVERYETLAARSKTRATSEDKPPSA
jgi:hypothetical protein